MSEGRKSLARWSKGALALGGLVLCEIGTRVGLPGLDGSVLSDYLVRTGGGFLLMSYNWLVGGALARGAVLALGLMPYVSAKIMLRLARSAFPRLDRADQRRLTRWTYGLTVGLSLIQSYGFARFVEAIPGAVANPGAGFIVRSIVILTAGAVTVTALTEQLMARTADNRSTPRATYPPAEHASRDAQEATLL